MEQPFQHKGCCTKPCYLTGQNNQQARLEHRRLICELCLSLHVVGRFVDTRLVWTLVQFLIICICFLSVNNPYNSQVYLCVAVQKRVFLYQWYEPWRRFMKVQVSFSSVQNTNITRYYSPSYHRFLLIHVVKICIIRNWWSDNAIQEFFIGSAVMIY